MKASELRQKSSDELNAQLLKLRQDQFKLSIQKTTGQLSQTHLKRENKREIARVKTVLREKSGE
jgi:large subunit ribosomal protein L29